MENDSQKLAVAFKRAQQQTVRQNAVPLRLRKKQITEELEYFKKQFTEATEKKNEKNILQFAKKLIELRGDLAVLNIEEHIQKNGNPKKEALQKYLQEYAKDCVNLTLAAKHHT